MSDNPKKPAPEGKAPPAKGKAKPINPPISDTLASSPIRHIMTRNPIYATPSTTVRRAIEMMLTHSISGLPVVDDTQVCLGLYTELDAMLQAAAQSLNSTIHYTKPPVMVMADATFREVLILMAQKKIKRVPIVDNRRHLMGIVSRRDLVRALHDDTSKKEPEKK